MTFKLLAANFIVFGLAWLTNLKPEIMFAFIGFNLIAFSLFRLKEVLSTFKVINLTDEDKDAGKTE